MTILVDDVAVIDEAWDVLHECGVSEETLRVVTNIAGYSVESLDAVAYVVFGCDVEQLKGGE